VLVLISKGMFAVTLHSIKMLRFLSEVAGYYTCIMAAKYLCVTCQVMVKSIT